MKRDRSLFKLMIVGCLLLVLISTSVPVRADIQPYQADTIKPYEADTTKPAKAEPIKPVKADPVEPYHVGQVEEYHADTIPVYQTDTLEPDKGRHGIATNLSQTGFLSYQAPEGWKRFEQEQTILYIAPEVPRGQLCVLAFLPEQVVGVYHEWFITETRGKLGAAVKMISATAPIEQHTGQLLATQITENKEGARLYTYYAGARQGDHGRLVAYMASSPELFLQHLPEFTALLQTLAIAEPKPQPQQSEMDIHDILQQVNPEKPVTKPDPKLEPEKPVLKPEPEKPVVKPEPKSTPNTPAKLANANGNAVEPLSNALRLNMTADEVIKKFGQPASDDRAWGGGIGFAGFGMIYNAKETEIWHFTLTGSARFNSGIGIGSSRAEVKVVFGTEGHVVYDQYDLYFYYNDQNLLEKIKIDPAFDTFKPYKRIPLGTSAAPAKTTVKPADFIGVWQGVTMVGQIVIKANGVYTFSGKQGTYTIAGNDIVFTGPLKAWNNGRATMNKGNLEFYWKNPSGAINYFAFVKSK